MKKLTKKLSVLIFIMCLFLAFIPNLSEAKEVKTSKGYIVMQDPDTALYTRPLKGSTVVKVPDQVIINGYIVRIIGIKKFPTKKVKKIYLGKNVFLIPKTAFTNYKRKIYAKKLPYKVMSRFKNRKYKLIKR